MNAKMTRRRFLELSAGALLPILLASCKPVVAPTQAPAAPTAAPAATVAVTKAPTATPAPKEPPKVHIWSHFMALTRPEGSDPDKLEAVKKHIIEKVGVEPVTYGPPPAGTAATERLNLLLASKSEELDVFQGDWTAMREAIIPINDLVKQYAPNVSKWYAGRWGLATDAEGKIWGVPRQAPQLFTQPTWLRTDWLKNAGLSQPKTFDDLEKAIEAFRKIEPAAVVLTNGLGDFRRAMVGAFTQYGYSNWYDTQDGKLKPPELQPDYKDWVARMADWYKKGWLFKESFVTHDDAEVAKGGKVGVFAGWYSRVTLTFSQILGAVPGMDFDWNREGIQGPKGFITTFHPGTTNTFLITKKAKHPDACLKLLDWQHEQENNCVAANGLKGVDWEWDEELNKAYGKQFYVKSLVPSGGKVYAGEFFVATSGGSIGNVWWGPADKSRKLHYDFLRDYAYNESAPGKHLVDAGVPYDMAVIRKEVPGLADINRLIDEETTKFITGMRPLGEWDAFLEQLNKAGLQDWIKAYTAQYKAAKGL